MMIIRNSLDKELEWLSINLKAAQHAGFRYAPASSVEILQKSGFECHTSTDTGNSDKVFQFESFARNSSRNSAIVTLSQVGHIDLQLFRSEQQTSIQSYHNQNNESVQQKSNPSAKLVAPMQVAPSRTATAHHSEYQSNQYKLNNSSGEHLSFNPSSSVGAPAPLIDSSFKSHVRESFDHDDSAFLDFDLDGELIFFVTFQ